MLWGRISAKNTPGGAIWARVPFDQPEINVEDVQKFFDNFSLGSSGFVIAIFNGLFQDYRNGFGSHGFLIPSVSASRGAGLAWSLCNHELVWLRDGVYVWVNQAGGYAGGTFPGEYAYSHVVGIER